MLLLILIFFSSVEVKAQGVLFRELYQPGTQGEFNLSHRLTTSTWNSKYGDLSKTEARISSETFHCSEECAYKFFAGHELQRFSRPVHFGETLEHPRFGGLLDISARKRFLAEVGITSPSDKPFNSIDETNLNLTLAIAPNENLVRKKENYWIFLMNYSNNRSFLPNIPLPAATYVVSTQSGWLYSIGAPFLSVSYMNFPYLSFRAMVGPYMYSTELAYGPPVFQYGLSSSWRQDSYFIAARSNRHEQFFIDEKDMSLFFKHPVTRKLFIEWKASYFFDQNIRYGEGFSRRTAPTEDLGTSVALTVHFKARLDSILNQ